MRLIDADALKNLFADIAREQPDLTGASETLGKIIDFQPTISPAANWTPCSVALPTIGEEVDVTYQINGKREVGCGRYIGNEQWIAKYGYGHDDEDGEVLAWKPPTEPYRG